MATDLYRAPLTAKLLKPQVFQLGCQLASLAALVALLYMGWGMDTIPGVGEQHPLIYTHAATLIFWVFWFMGLVLAIGLVGRAWCGICPLGYVSDLLGRSCLGLGWPKAGLLTGGPVAFFFAGVAAVLFLDVHKSPHLTTLFVGGVVLLTVASGLLFKRAGFCKLICPIGLVLGVYSRFSPLAVKTLDADRCKSCKERGCVDRKGKWLRWDVGNLVLHKKSYTSGCPVALNPPTMDPTDCLVCMRCVRNCSHDNLGLFWGRQSYKHPLSTNATIFLPLLTGLVFLALLRTWPDARDFLTPVAYPSEWVWAPWLGLVLPLVLLVLPVVLVQWGRASSGAEVGEPSDDVNPGPAAQVGKKTGFTSTAAKLLIPFIGPILGGHSALALVKINAKAAYLELLVYDPFGISTYLAVHVANTLPVPDLLAPLWALKWVAVGAGAAGATGGIALARRWWTEEVPPFGRVALWLSMTGVCGIITSALVHWLFTGR